jgi:ElaB/YqjD/DUF883 family membrane-anchored ribosome-binding protein
MNTINDKLVRELQSLMTDFEALAKSALSAAGEQAGNAAEELGQGLARARERLTEFERDAVHGVRHGARKTDGYVRDRPWMAIGIAAAAAFLLGVVAARRGQSDE